LPATETISIPGFAIALGVTQEVAYRWVRRGVASTPGGKDVKKGECIAKAPRPYFGWRCHWDGTGESPRHRVGWLSVRIVANGIEPVSG
jgi:hypothetical protein